MVKIYHVHEDAPMSLTRELFMIRTQDHALAVRELWAQGFYTQMAQSDGDSLSMAYRITQNGVDYDSWSMDDIPGLKVMTPCRVRGGRVLGHRSTSVGDILENNQGRWIVASFGFLPLDME